MGTKIRIRFSLIIAAVVICAMIYTTELIAAKAIPTVLAQGQQTFMAKLTGQNEVPPKNTKATGTFEVQLSADGRVSNYVLNLTNISNVTLIHIHQGAKGTNGPIVVTLYKSANPGGQLKQTSLKGKIFSKQFEGPFAGKYISNLMILINQGNAYINVHTKQNPQGEIRGQLVRS